MPLYRIFHLPPGAVQTKEPSSTILCEDDDAAITYAKSFTDELDHEVWDGARLVKVIRAKGA